MTPVAGNLWFVLAIGCNVNRPNLQAINFPQRGPWVFNVKCNLLYGLAMHAYTRQLKHRRRKRGGGGEGATRPPKFQVGGGHRPPTLPTVYIMNFIAVL